MRNTPDLAADGRRRATATNCAETNGPVLCGCPRLRLAHESIKKKKRSMKLIKDHLKTGNEIWKGMSSLLASADPVAVVRHTGYRSAPATPGGRTKFPSIFNRARQFSTPHEIMFGRPDKWSRPSAAYNAWGEMEPLTPAEDPKTPSRKSGRGWSVQLST